MNQTVEHRINPCFMRFSHFQLSCRRDTCINFWGMPFLAKFADLRIMLKLASHPLFGETMYVNKILALSFPYNLVKQK